MTDLVSRILFDISNKAHKYVKSRTTKLTQFKESDETPITPFSRFDDTFPAKEESAALQPYLQRLHTSSPQGKRPVPGPPPFAKDYARIIHSPSFRRLQGKTQLIPAGENEFFRTRLTHSLEVAEIATRIADKLNKDPALPKGYRINLELVTCAGLLHDIGHPPFGHSGEVILNQRMTEFGGFEGNAQTLRIITCLENRLGLGVEIQEAIMKPRGLNLTVGTLASVLKYDALIDKNRLPRRERGSVTKGYYATERPTVEALHRRLRVHPGKLQTLECQIMDLADDIAYSTYDLEDTLEAGIVTPFDLMSIDDTTLGMIEKDVEKGVHKRDSGAQVSTSALHKHLADVFVTLLIDGEPDSPYDFRIKSHRVAFVGRTYAESLLHAKDPLVRRQYLETLIEQNIASVSLVPNDQSPFLSRLTMDRERLITMEAMKAVNFHKVINSRRMQLHHGRNQKIIGTIFDAFAADEKGALLSDLQRRSLEACNCNHTARMRLIADIISSLTDLEAINLYDQLNSTRNARFWDYSR